MRQYLEGEVLRQKMLEFWKLGRPVGAICHGMMLFPLSLSLSLSLSLRTLLIMYCVCRGGCASTDTRSRDGKVGDSSQENHRAAKIFREFGALYHFVEIG